VRFGRALPEPAPSGPKIVTLRAIRGAGAIVRERRATHSFPAEYTGRIAVIA
jgi:hypothetical protein